MTKCRINFHDRVNPSFVIDVVLARVPVCGDLIDHKDRLYNVTVVKFSTENEVPYIVARRKEFA